MKMDKKTIFSLLIVILFVGSLFAMITFSDNTSTPGEDYTPIDTNQNLELVSYTATIDANVGELFPQIIAAGRPLDFEETSINTKLLDVSGIKNKQIEFRPDADGNINLIITLSVVPEKKQEIIDGITNLNIFETPEFYQFGLLEIPEKVKFTNDQNQEIEYEFIVQNMEGILGMETLKGDNLSVAAYATFRGTELIQSRGIEQINNSNQFQMLIGYENFKITEFKDKIYSQIDFDFNEVTSSADKNIELKIKNEFSIVQINMEITKPLIFSNGDKNKEEITNRLNLVKENYIQHLNENNDINKYKLFDFEIDENTTIVNFENNFIADWHNAQMQGILFKLDSDMQIIQRPVITANIEFDLNEFNDEKLSQILNKTKEELNLKVLASVDTTEVIISGKKYNYKEPTTDVLLDYPEDLNKTEIELNLQGYYQRDNLLYLSLSK